MSAFINLFFLLHCTCICRLNKHYSDSDSSLSLYYLHFSSLVRLVDSNILISIKE